MIYAVAAATISLFLKRDIEKMFQMQAETLRKDIMGIKDDLRQSNERIEQTTKKLKRE